jgi:hypothetical protein
LARLSRNWRRSIRRRPPRRRPAVAAAVGEAWVGAGRGVGDVVLFAVGLHAIGGIVRGGVPITGARGRAGSVGWVSLNPVEREGLPQGGVRRGGGRRGRHRAPDDLAHQGGRSIRASRMR